MANLPPPSSHRLPTVSASQALQNLHSRGVGAVSTGLDRLDSLLQGRGVSAGGASLGTGGLLRGQVTEIYGPPGAGKTTFGLQTSVSALHAGHHVIWLDCGSPLAPNRLQDILHAPRLSHSAPASSAPVHTPSSQDLPLRRFRHYTIPTLPHLLAMILHPPTSFPPPGTAIIVVDTLSTLFDNAYPRSAATFAKTSDAARWATGRKYGVMNDLISSLGKMAALRNLAVLITTQAVTRVRTGAGALLLPALNGLEWDGGISTRMVLFQDWALLPKGRTGSSEEIKRIRFVGLVKHGGVTVADEGETGNAVPFEITAHGMRNVDMGTALTVPVQLYSPARPLKRSFSKVADSEDEDAGSEDDYGWVEEDQVAAEGIIDEAELADTAPDAI